MLKQNGTDQATGGSEVENHPAIEETLDTLEDIVISPPERGEIVTQFEYSTVFYKISTPGEMDLQVAKEQNSYLNQRSKEFRSELGEAVPETLDKATRVARLREFIGLDGPGRKIDTFYSSELMTVFNMFKDAGAFSEMLEMFEKSDNTLFIDSPIVKELVAVTYNKKSDPDPLKTIELTDSLIDIEMVNGEVLGAKGKAHLLQNKAALDLLKLRTESSAGLTGELAEKLQRAEERFQKYFGYPAEDRDLEALAERAMRNSLEAYSGGFNVAYEYYPGINAAYRQLALGRIEDARDTCELVYYSCLREGGAASKEYWCVSSMLEAACLAGKSWEEVQPVLVNVLGVANKSWMVETTVVTLKDAMGKLESIGEDVTTMRRVLDALSERLDLTRQVENSSGDKEQAAARLRDSIKQYEAAPDLTPEDIANLNQELLDRALDRMSPEQLNKHLALLADGRRDAYFQHISPEKLREIKVQALLENSFSYRGLASNFIGGNTITGNLSVGGQLFDQTISRFDIRQFDDLLKAPLNTIMQFDRMEPEGKAALKEAQDLGIGALSEIADRTLFTRVAVALVRHHFKTFTIENLHDPRHDEYDARAVGFIEAGGAAERRGSDSRTNISLALALSLGDCRHHGQAMQMLADAWQKEKFNDHLDQADFALKTDNRELYESTMQALANEAEWELRTFDVVLETQAEMQQWFDEKSKTFKDWKYKPARDAHHQLVVDGAGNFHDMEDHTCTHWLNRGKGKLDFADSFYRNVYNLGNRLVDMDEIELRVVSKFEKDPKTNQMVEKKVLGMVVPVDPLEWTDKLSSADVSCGVRFSPAPYAGERSKATNELGFPRCMGHIVEQFDLSEMLGAKTKLSVEEFNANLLKMPAAIKLLLERGHIRLPAELE